MFFSNGAFKKLNSFLYESDSNQTMQWLLVENRLIPLLPKTNLEKHTAYDDCDADYFMV